MSGSPFGVLEYFGAEKQAGATKDASKLSYETAIKQIEAQKEMFNKLLELQQPYNEAGVNALGKLEGMDPTGNAQRYMSSIERSPSIALPELDLSSFSYQFDPNDPTYQYRQKEMQKTIDQAAAARGNYNSRPVINALAEGNLALTADESEKQFQRALDTYKTNTGTALSQYGADYGRASDTYNANYGKQTDLFNMAKNIGSTDWNALIDQVKIGQGSASQAGSGAQATGQGISSAYGLLGNAQQNYALEQGNIWSNYASGQGANMGNTANSILSYLYG